MANEDTPYAWQTDYLAALAQKDEKLLSTCVIKAREHIVKRRVQLKKGGPDDREIAAIEIALKTLRVLYSNWL